MCHRRLTLTWILLGHLGCFSFNEGCCSLLRERPNDQRLSWAVERTLIYVSSHVRGHLLKIMTLWLGLADLQQEERVQRYFDVKSSWLPVGILLGEAKALSPPPLLPHLSSDLFFLMINRQGLTRSKSKLWSRIRTIGLFSLVTSGSDTHWVPVTRALYFLKTLAVLSPLAVCTGSSIKPAPLCPSHHPIPNATSCLHQTFCSAHTLPQSRNIALHCYPICVKTLF